MFVTELREHILSARRGSVAAIKITDDERVRERLRAVRVARDYHERGAYVDIRACVMSMREQERIDVDASSASRR